MLSLTSQGRPLILESAYGEHSDVRSWRTGVIQATGANGGFPPSQTGALKVNDCLASKAATVCVDDYRLLSQTTRNRRNHPNGKHVKPSIIVGPSIASVMLFRFLTTDAFNFVRKESADE